jgi:hypothetical protein
LVAIERLVHDLSTYFTIGTPTVEEKFSVYPLLSEVPTPVIGLVEAEKIGTAWIQEEKSESVEWLEAINKGSAPVLIPYLHQVEGGKQDRTIFEPIIVPTGKNESSPMRIPAKCIEMSRWTYSSSRGESTSSKFKSAKTRMSSQMSHFVAKTGEQAAVWDSVESARLSIGLEAEAAPTSSYREMNVTVYEQMEDMKKLLETLLEATKFENQVGIVVVYGDRVLGLEAYGSTRIWSDLSEEVLKGFLIDKYFLKDTEVENERVKDLTQALQHEMKGVKINKGTPSGIGDLYRFESNDWQGITVLYQGVPIHLYAVKKHIDAGENIERIGGAIRPSVQRMNVDLTEAISLPEEDD